MQIAFMAIYLRIFVFILFELILKFYQANEVCVRDAW